MLVRFQIKVKDIIRLLLITLPILINISIQQQMSKAAEILRALNSQIQHIGALPNHPLATPTNQTVEQYESDERSIPPQEQLSRPESQIPSSFNAKMKYEENLEAPGYLLQILKQQVGTMHSSLFENIESILRQREKNAYNSYTKGQNDYLKALLDQISQGENSHLDIISGLMSKRLTKVEGDLQEGVLVVHHERNLNNRKQLEKLEQIDVARMIKIKDGELRSKMDILHNKMEELGNISSWDLDGDKRIEQQLQKKLVENLDSNNFSLNSERTKIAKDYVKHMQQQRVFFEKRRKERQVKFQQQQTERQAELKEAEEMRDLAKHQEIVQKIEIRRKKRIQEEKEYEVQEQKANKVLAEYHRKQPIFKIKQKEFQQKFLKPQKKYREEKLNQIRQNKRSLSLYEIKKHEEKYLSNLQLERAKRNEQFKLIKSEEENKKVYYKGSAHARIQQMTKEDVLRSYSLHEANKLKANRMKQYSEVIQKHHLPTVDEEKKKQLVRFIEDDMMRKKHARKLFKQVVDQTTSQVKFQSYYEEIPPKNLYKEGNRLFEEAKKHLKKKDKDDLAAKVQDINPNSHSAVKVQLLQTGSDPEKKTQNLWEIRAKQLEEMTNSDVVDAKNFEYVKQNIQNLDSKAAQKEELLKRIDLSIDEHINEKGMLDNYYLKSIKQKMKLLQ